MEILANPVQHTLINKVEISKIKYYIQKGKNKIEKSLCE